LSLLNELKRRNVLRVGAAYIVAAWLIIQVAETIFPLFGFGDTPARLIVIVLSISFIPSLIFSWVFEITPEGLKRDADVDRDKSITQTTGKKLDRIILVVLALALAYFAFDKFVLVPARVAEIVEETMQKVRSDVLVESYGDKSIAVLPFVNMSDDASNEYFSDGISEELLNLLAKIPELRVIARTSSFSYKGKDVKVADVARELNVGHVLEGSVRKAGNQVRITAQLIEARSDTHLWSGTYDRELENIFAVQDEISIAIVGALKNRLGLEVEAAPRAIAAANTEAYEAYLRGRYLIVQRTPNTLERAILEFEKAIVFDPQYALAHAELSNAILLLMVYGEQGAADVIASAAHHAELAMDLDPTIAEVFMAAAFVLIMQDNPEEALARYEQTIQINPNLSWAYMGMAQTLDELGRYAEAFTKFEMAKRLDPLSIPAIANYGNALIQRKRLDDAAHELQTLNAIVPIYGAYFRGSMTSLGGEWANMILADLDGLQINPKPVYGRRRLNLIFATVGLEKEAFAIWAYPRPKVLRILGRPEDAVTAAEEILDGEFATVYARRDLGLALASAGDYVRARPILEEMWQQSSGLVTNDGKFLDHHAAALIAIRRDAGEEAKVGELIAAIKDNVRRNQEAGITADGPSGIRRAFRRYDVDYEEGLADFLAGKRETGLALIAKGSEDGYFIPLREAYLQTLYDDPGFAPILAGQQARQTRERNKFLTVVCNDNPYEAVWQPAEGTCERFAKTVGD